MSDCSWTTLRGVLLVGLAAGCSAPKHPPFVDEYASGKPPSGGGKSGATDDGSGATGGVEGEQTPTKPVVTPPVTSSDFDPDKVYLFGTLKEAVTYYALAQVETPNSYVLGFDSSERGYSLNADGLYYTNGEHVYRFVTDAALSLPLKDVTYPANPAANDVVVDTPRCELGAQSGFVLGSTGRLIYRCLDVGTTHVTDYEGTDPVFDGDAYCSLVAVGANDLALCSYGDSTQVFNLTRSSEIIPVTPVTRYLLAHRAHGDGFWVVEATSPRALWQVNADGSAEKLGEYPEKPEGYFTGYGSTALAADGALYEISKHFEGNKSGADVVIRFTIEGAADIVYDENDNPNVKIHGSGLLTGN